MPFLLILYFTDYNDNIIIIRRNLLCEWNLCHYKDSLLLNDHLKDIFTQSKLWFVQIQSWPLVVMPRTGTRTIPCG